jgi:hypothetical protein
MSDRTLPHRVCAAIERLAEFPGYVRQVDLVGSEVRVEYEIQSTEGGGIYYRGRYPSRSDAIAALERFLDRQLDHWWDFDPWSLGPNVNPSELEVGHSNVKAALRRGGLPVPPQAAFALEGSSYWEQFLPLRSDSERRR